MPLRAGDADGGRIDGGIAVRSRDVQLDACDVVLVRGIPRGSLEQIVFRVDALHALEAAGVRAVNGALAIERAIDKFLASALLAAAGVPTPRTVACERAEDALEAFAALGSDVIVKPLFGSMGFGMARVEDPDIAQRVFRALEIERAVYYLQETVPHDGVDVRALVVGERVVAAIERVGTGWRANLARGARARPVELDERRARAVRAGRRGARRRLRRRRPAARRRRARLRARGQRHPGLARASSRRRGSTWRRRSSRTSSAPDQRSARSSSAPIAPPCRAVATSAPAAPAPASARRSAASRTPPPASSSTPGTRARSSPKSATSGPSPEPTRARSSTTASRAPASARRASASAGAMRGERRVGREHPPVAQVEAEDERRAGQLAPEPRERPDAGQRLGADHDAGDAEREQPLDRRGRRGAGVDHHLRLPRQRGDDVGVARAAGDRVEVGDVELVEAEPLAHRARDVAPGPRPRRSGCAAGDSVRGPRGRRAPRLRP